MKKLITILIFAFTFSAFALELPFKRKNLIQKTVKWKCSHLPYKDTVLLPKSENIVVKTWTTIKGKTKVSLRPNIFNEDIFEKVKKVVKDQKIEDKPKFILDYKDCIQDFINDYKEDLASHKEKCNGCLKDIDSNASAVVKKINKGNIFKKSNGYKKLAPFVPGHDFSKNTSSNDVKSALNSLCKTQKISGSEMILLTSREITEKIKKYSSDVEQSYDPKCYKKLADLNLKVLNKIDCNVVKCESIDKLKSEYSGLENKLSDIRQKAIDDKQNDLLNSTQIYSASELDQAEIEKLLNSVSGTGRYCSIEMPAPVTKSGTKRKYANMFDYPEVLSLFLEKKIKDIDLECQKRILTQAMAAYYRKDTLLEDKFCKENDCPIIKNLNYNYETAITDMIQSLYSESEVKYYCEKRKDLSGSLKVYNKVTDLIDVLDEANQCRELKPGEHRVVNKHSYESPTGVEFKYVLEKQSENKMNATLALNFGEGEAADKMRNSTKQCLERMSTYFTKGEEQITVDILSPKEAKLLPMNKRPPVVNIKIGEAGMRSNSHHYASDAKCPTLTHEVLHLMGLCDEYTETVTGVYVDTETGEVLDPKVEGPNKKKAGKAKFVTVYNSCRSIPKSNSVMKSQWNIINNTVKTKRTCECVNSLCESILSDGSEMQKKYMSHNPWNGLWTVRNKCKSDFINHKKIKLASDLNKFGFPMEMISESENKITFYDHDFYAGTSGGGMGAGSFVHNEGSLYKRKYTCSCETEDCMEEFNTLKNRIATGGYTNNVSCPSGSIEKSRDGVKSDAETGFGEYKNKQFTLTNKPTNKSLLHKAQFDRIKWGTCTSKVKTYSECAKNAYKRLAKDCPDIPAYCKDEEKWLKSSQ